MCGGLRDGHCDAYLEEVLKGLRSFDFFISEFSWANGPWAWGLVVMIYHDNRGQWVPLGAVFLAIGGRIFAS